MVRTKLAEVTVFQETGRDGKKDDFPSVFYMLHLALNVDRHSDVGRQQP